jgi:hypothetical protein
MDESKWTDEEKDDKKLMTAAWLQLACFTVRSDTLKSAMVVKSKDPREEALTKPTREFEPSKMLDMKDLLEDFHKI